MERSGGKVKRLEQLNEDQLKKFAEKLAQVMKRGLILLIGQLGAGKTTFVKGLAKGLGIEEKMVRSPTFVIMNVYQGTQVLYHVDLYRIDDVNELFYIGIEDALDDEGIVAVEWADLFPELWIDVPRIEVKIEVRSENERDLVLREVEEEGVISETIRRWEKERTR